MKKTAIGVVILLALAAWVCAFASESTVPGMRAQADFRRSGRVTLSFRPDSAGVYDVCALNGADCSVESAVLLRNGHTVAQGADEPLLMSVSLNAGQTYDLELEGSGVCTVELARHVEGRSALCPEELEGMETSALLARPGSARWYRFSAGAAVCDVIARGDRPLRVELYDADFRVLRRAETWSENLSCLTFTAEADRSYYLRVSASDGGACRFDLYRLEADRAVSRSERLLTGDLTLRRGGMRSVRSRTLPDGVQDSLLWLSSDETVAQVDERGTVTALAAGEAWVCVFAPGGTRQKARATVESVVPLDLNYPEGSVNLSAGSRVTPELTVYPEAASDAAVEYESSDETVVQVSSDGELLGVAEGTAAVRAKWGDLCAELIVQVGPPAARYRALLIGEQMYPENVNTPRTGAVNTVYNLEALLRTAVYEDDQTCETHVEFDLTAKDALDALDGFFAQNGEKDVSVLYLSCHGAYRGGETVMQFVDGSELTATELELALRKIPGTVVVLADFCDSGGLVENGALADGFTEAFASGAAAFAGSKYKVLCSACVGQNSYRLGYGEEEGEIATVFAMALCDGLGWSMERQIRSSLNADLDYDGSITLWETYQYAARRVKWYLSVAGGESGEYEQDVRVYPEGDPFVLYRR